MHEFPIQVVTSEAMSEEKGMQILRAVAARLHDGSIAVDDAKKERDKILQETGHAWCPTISKHERANEH